MRSMLRTAPVLALVLALGAPLARSQEEAPAAVKPPAPIFATTAPQVEQVIEENTYYYKVRAYTPPVEVKPVNAASASYANPETAAIANISAMVAGDFEWWRSTWTPAAQRMMSQRDRDLDRAPSEWLEIWARVFPGRTIELTHRIDTGSFVLIAYRVLPSADEPEGETIELTGAYELDDGRWLSTQALASDPVLAYWQQPGFRIKKMVRGIELDP